MDPCWQGLPGHPGTLAGKAHLLSLLLIHSVSLAQLWPLVVACWLEAVSLITLLCS